MREERYGDWTEIATQQRTVRDDKEVSVCLPAYLLNNRTDR